MVRTNFVLDISLLVAFLAAMEPRFTGVAIHEWLSLALGLTVIVHLLLHWKWIAVVARRFFSKLWHSSRLKFVVDVLLFVTMVVVMESGILISRSVLPALGISVNASNFTWRTLHSLSADLAILLVGLHFALSWDWVSGTFKRLLIVPFRRRSQPKAAMQLAAVPMEVRTTREEE